MPSAAAPPPVSRAHIPALDGVRGLACLAVLVGHFPHYLSGSLGWGAPLAMDTFFALSGFLITRILLASKEDGHGLKRFYWRRSLRIFPIYFLMIAGLWVAVALGLQPALQTTLATVYLYNFYHPFSNGDPFYLTHCWSLCVEEQFYLVWPFVVYTLTREGARAVSVWAIAAPLLGLLAVMYLATDLERVWEIAYPWTPTRTPALAAGALLAFDEARWRRRPRFAVMTGAILSLTGLAVLSDQVGIVLREARAMWGNLPLAAGLLLMATGASWLNAWPARMLASPLPATVGRISYGLYLYHGVIYGLLGFRMDARGATYKDALIAVSLTFLAALLSYRFIESPILRFKDRAWSWRRPATSLGREP